MTKLDALSAQILRRFGECTLERFDGQWRVWIRNAHYDHGAHSGSLSGTGRTADEACERLIRFASRPEVHIGPGYRCNACPPHSDY